MVRFRIGKSRIMKRLKNKFLAFTMTEVLVALGVVGVLAIIMVSAIAKMYKGYVMNDMFQQTVFSVNDSLRTFANDNDGVKQRMKAALADESGDLAKSLEEEFIKKYIKYSKYCGDNASQCIETPSYYVGNEKKFMSVLKTIRDPEYVSENKWEYHPKLSSKIQPWRCAVLRNGMSLCINFYDENSTHNTPIAIVDLNGKKGPNVYGRDVRMMRLSPDMIPFSDVNYKPIFSVKGILDTCKIRPTMTGDISCCGKYPYVSLKGDTTKTGKPSYGYGVNDDDAAFACHCRLAEDDDTKVQCFSDSEEYYAMNSEIACTMNNVTKKVKYCCADTIYNDGVGKGNYYLGNDDYAGQICCSDSTFFNGHKSVCCKDGDNFKKNMTKCCKDSDGYYTLECCSKSAVKTSNNFAGYCCAKPAFFQTKSREYLRDNCCYSETATEKAQRACCPICKQLSKSDSDYAAFHCDSDTDFGIGHGCFLRYDKDDGFTGTYTFEGTNWDNDFSSSSRKLNITCSRGPCYQMIFSLLKIVNVLHNV